MKFLWASSFMLVLAFVSQAVRGEYVRNFSTSYSSPTATVSCPSGEQLTGGGGNCVSLGPLGTGWAFLSSSYPINEVEWAVTCETPKNQYAIAEAYAFCESPKPVNGTHPGTGPGTGHNSTTGPVTGTDPTKGGTVPSKVISCTGANSCSGTYSGTGMDSCAGPNSCQGSHSGRGAGSCRGANSCGGSNSGTGIGSCSGANSCEAPNSGSCAKCCTAPNSCGGM